MDYIVRAVAAGMTVGASSAAPRSGVVTIVQCVRCMRGMGCMTYHGEEDAEVAGLWLEKKKGKSYKSDIGARDLIIFIYRGVKLYMGGSELRVDLLLLELYDFNLNLGMA
jgi:hypothetical protein